MEEVKITKKQRKRMHHADAEYLFNMFNHDLRDMAKDKLKTAGHPNSEAEITKLILIWFDEYLNGNGTNLKVPSDFMTRNLNRVML